MAVMLPVYTAVNLALGPNLDTRFINVLNTTDGGDIRVFDTRHNLPFKWLVGSEQFCPDQTFYPLLFALVVNMSWVCHSFAQGSPGRCCLYAVLR